MVDLKCVSGLPISLGGDGKLVFGRGLPEVRPAVRKASDMREVLYDPAAADDVELYFMYRDVHRPEDEELICKSGLRYDITIIKPGRLGREFVKTAGHYHPVKPGTDVTYPEVYEVLFGTAHYLLQKPDETGRRALDVILVEAQPGDKVVIPPGYGHITINPGDEPLVMTNWVAAGFSSVYDPIRKTGGGAYFEVAECEGASRFIPNPKYEFRGPLHSMEAQEVPEFGLTRGVPMYTAFLENPGAFDWLVNPEKYGKEFQKALTELAGERE